MTTLLHLDASVRGDSLLPRRLSRDLVAAMLGEMPDAQILRRDLAAAPPPYVDHAWIAASLTRARVRPR